MENLLGIHGSKTVKNYSRKDNNLKESIYNNMKNNTKSRIIMRSPYKISCENIVIIILFIISAILLYTSFSISFKKYKLINNKHEYLHNIVIDNNNIYNSNL